MSIVSFYNNFKKKEILGITLKVIEQKIKKAEKLGSCKVDVGASLLKYASIQAVAIFYLTA